MGVAPAHPLEPPLVTTVALACKYSKQVTAPCSLVSSCCNQWTYISLTRRTPHAVF